MALLTTFFTAILLESLQSHLFSSMHRIVVLEKPLESPLDCKKIQPVHLKEISPECSLEGLMLKLKLQYFGHLMWRDWFEKTLMLGRIEGRRRRGRQDEMAGWHHQLDGRESEWTPGGLACCDSWGHKESDTTEQLNWRKLPNSSYSSLKISKQK